MAFTVLSNDMYSEIQSTLLEPVNAGISYASGLYTASEMAERLNQRLREFYKRTQLVATRDTTILVATNVRDQSVPSNIIDIIRLGIEISCSSVDASVLTPQHELPLTDGASADATSLQVIWPITDGGGAASIQENRLDGGTP